MRLSRQKMQKIIAFKMVNVKSDFVGTEPKIDRIGCFDAIVEETIKKKISSMEAAENTSSTDENEVVCKITVPNGYHFKVGYMISLLCKSEPELKIVAMKKYTGHTECDCVSWN